MEPTNKKRVLYLGPTKKTFFSSWDRQTLYISYRQRVTNKKMIALTHQNPQHDFLFFYMTQIPNIFGFCGSPFTLHFSFVGHYVTQSWLLFVCRSPYLMFLFLSVPIYIFLVFVGPTFRIYLVSLEPTSCTWYFECGAYMICNYMDIFLCLMFETNKKKKLKWVGPTKKKIPTQIDTHTHQLMRDIDIATFS